MIKRIISVETPMYGEKWKIKSSNQQIYINMKKNAYVQFTGKLPKELKGMKLPIFGKVEKKVGKLKVIVKPRYKRFEVSVAITELTEVDYDTYQGKAKKTAPVKPAAKKPVAKKTPPVKKEKKSQVMKTPPPVEKKADIPTSPETPLKVVPKEEAPKAVNEMKPCETKSGIGKAVEEAKAISEKPVEATPVKEEPVIPAYAAKDDAMPKTDPVMDEYLDQQESQNGGAVIWGVVAIVIAAAICAYIYLH